MEMTTQSTNERIRTGVKGRIANGRRARKPAFHFSRSSRVWTIYGRKWNSANFLERMRPEFEYSRSIEGMVEANMQRDNVIMKSLGIDINLSAELADQWRADLTELYKRVRHLNSKSSGSNEAHWDKHFMPLYNDAINGDVDAAYTLWILLEDCERLKLTLHLWELAEERLITPQVWAATLLSSWQRGNAGCLLLKAKLTQKQIVSMFNYACPATLMGDEEELSRFHSLSEDIEIWRGTTSSTKYRETGMSWSSSGLQAEWFAYRNLNDDGDEPILIRAIAKKSDLLASFNYENEIVVNPMRTTRLNILSITRLSNDYESRMKELRNMLHEDAQVIEH